MQDYQSITDALAAAFVAGAWEVDSLVDRGSGLLGRRWRWLHPLAARLTATFATGLRPRQRAVARFLRRDAGLVRAFQKHHLALRQPIGEPCVMAPLPVARQWEVPALCSAAALAHWLGVTSAELDWLARVRARQAGSSSSRWQHYRYRPLTKRPGQIRLVEAPKPRLKEAQRRILHEILDPVPLHDAAHGFRSGRSVKSFVSVHTGQPVVVRMDLCDYFPSIRAARIRAVFRSIGYPEQVADLLAGLCTNSTPEPIWDHLEIPLQQQRDARWLYVQPHLPQGAPTSPALANLCSYRLDCRLTALARTAAANYTRYADDLAFSGGEEFGRCAARFCLHASAIAIDEGFAVHFRKTRIMRQGTQQRLAGLVVNQRLNIPRPDYDRLKAILVNCVRHGPDSQNRSAQSDFQNHLNGHVAYVEQIHPPRGQRLRSLFDQIRW